MRSHDIDLEIVTLCKEGGQEAFRSLLERYSSSIYNFTVRLTNENDAPDIVQEVFIKVWKNLHKFEPSKASFKTWIFTITRNSITDFLRKKKDVLFTEMEKYTDEGEDSFVENIPAEDLLPDEILEKLENSELLNQMLKKLSPAYQEILTLHYQEEMTFEEIGEILNKPLNTAKSQNRRALLLLKKMLE